MNHNIIIRRPVWSVTGWGITCVKMSRYVMSLGGHRKAIIVQTRYSHFTYNKTLYQTGMIFNIRAHTKVETLIYPYIPAQHWYIAFSALQ